MVAATFGFLTFAAWAFVNAPQSEPPWPERILGVGFSPFQGDEDPTRGDAPSVERIAADLDLLAGRVQSVRTYSTLGPFADVPRLASERHLRAAIGAWLDTDLDRNTAEIDSAIELGSKYPNIGRIFVGNEVILRGDLTVAQLGAYLDRVADATKAPVGTAEPWHVWLQHPELAEHVDFIGIHLLPYWEGVDVEVAVDYVFSCLSRVQARFPHLPVVIGEVGWPSRGRTRQAAVASVTNEALFLRRFLARAQKDPALVYYVMEAFDQPWKAEGEGEVGAYWGIFDADRAEKFEFVDPIVRVPEWQMLAGISILISLLLVFLFFSQSAKLATGGRLVIASVVFATATVSVWVVYDYTTRYLTMTNVVVGALLILGMLGLFAVLFAEAHEWSEAHWITGYKRPFAPQRRRPDATRPKVSIHVPAYNEPAEMLIETLDALSRLDYPDFEVLVIDNNTTDPALWRPVEAHCAALDPTGTRFRFFHVEQLAGFKAGALNFGLARTSPEATIIAVIDADYQVDPSWLEEMVPGFDDPRVAIMQAPQDFRDGNDSLFKAASFAEYRGFFAIGMVTRNERNAIIQHGTMTLVRRSVLEAVGAWSTESITEDADLGLRIFEAGHTAHYVPVSYGRGLMPDTFLDFKKQRFRWAYGAIQILKAHWRAFLGLPPRGAPGVDAPTYVAGLTRGQRYHFIAGWLPWIADGFNLLVTAMAIAWSVAMAVDPYVVAPPIVLITALPLTLFAFKLIKLVHLYMARVGANPRQTLAAAIAGLALSHTIAWAVIKGLVTRNEPFFRTPKLASRHGFLVALRSASSELVILVFLLGSLLGLSTIGPDLRCLELSVWKAMLLIQALPYMAAVLFSVLSAFPFPARWLGRSQLEGRRMFKSGFAYAHARRSLASASKTGVGA